MRAPKSVSNVQVKLQSVDMPLVDASLYLEAKQGSEESRLEWNKQASAYNDAAIKALGELEAKSILKVII